MRKRFLILSTLTLSLFASSLGVYADTNELIPELETSIEKPELRDVVLINNDLCFNTSYQKNFSVLKENGSTMQINFVNNASDNRVWAKININGSYVYSKILEPGDSALYNANATTGNYEITLDSPSGAQMNTSINARQY